MAASMMQCPNCGRLFPTEEQEITDNGNVVCSSCARKDSATEEE